MHVITRDFLSFLWHEPWKSASIIDLPSSVVCVSTSNNDNVSTKKCVALFYVDKDII